MTTFRRRIIREKVLQVLYAYEISKEPLPFIQEQQLAPLKDNHADFDFAKELVRQTVQHEPELDTLIASKVSHWEMNRIALIDKIILRMGICEMLYFPDIPPKVTINEAIEVAKSFSTQKSSHFVNGVLDSILIELRKGDRLRKAGRGLLDSHPSETPSQTNTTPPPDEE